MDVCECAQVCGSLHRYARVCLGVSQWGSEEKKVKIAPNNLKVRELK